VFQNESDTRTSTVALLENGLSDSLTLTGWDIASSDGVEVVGMGTVPYSQSAGGAGLEGFPPTAWSTQSIEFQAIGSQGGPVLDAGGGDLDPAEPPQGRGLVLLIGYHLSPGTERGTLNGITLRYQDGRGERGEIEIPFTLAVCLGSGQPCAAGQGGIS
jgi:hypothetical protein